jgi:hypothetical protein
MARVECDIARNAHARPTFTDCAARYVEQSRGKRSFDTIRWHVALVQSYLGYLEPKQVHDQTLAPFVKARLAEGSGTFTSQSHCNPHTLLSRSPVLIVNSAMRARCGGSLWNNSRCSSQVIGWGRLGFSGSMVISGGNPSSHGRPS